MACKTPVKEDLGCFLPLTLPVEETICLPVKRKLVDKKWEGEGRN